MVRCEEGYLCQVCGEEVEAITESDLYLRYVMGEVPPLQLPKMPECHIVCNPVLAQYIVDENFPTVVCDGPFSKANLDSEFVSDKEALVTRAWKRLQSIPTMGVGLPDYPLTEVIQRWQSGQDG